MNFHACKNNINDKQNQVVRHNADKHSCFQNLLSGSGNFLNLLKIMGIVMWFR